MTPQEFRDFAATISPKARIDGLYTFTIDQSFYEYLISFRGIVNILNSTTGKQYDCEYVFNSKKARYFPV